MKKGILVAGCIWTLYVLVPVTIYRYNYWMLDLDHISTQAAVIQTFDCGYGDRLIVRFSDLNGSTIISQESLCEDRKYYIGEQITVFYRPTAPAYVALSPDLDSGGGIIFVLFLGLDLGILTLIGYILGLRVHLVRQQAVMPGGLLPFAGEAQPFSFPEVRRWALNRMIYRAGSSRWFWLVIGLIVGGCGAFIALTAHQAHFQPITSTLAYYSYTDHDLKLAGRTTTYQFHAGDFQPALPKQIPSGTQMTIWVLPGYTNIDALQIIDRSGAVKAQYTDDYFDRPEFHFRLDRFMGSLFALWGGLIALGSLVGPPLTRWRQSRAARAR